jgi:transposase-like protein
MKECPRCGSERVCKHGRQCSNRHQIYKCRGCKRNFSLSTLWGRERRITDEQYRKIVEGFMQGLGPDQVAKAVGVGYCTAVRVRERMHAAST